MGKNEERMGGSTPFDQSIWNAIETMIEDNQTPLKDVLEAFPAYMRRLSMSRFLAHYEIFKLVQDTPGVVVECGVYRGASLLTWAKLLEIFCPGDRVRKVIGFDNFAGFPALDEKDGPEAPSRSKVVGGWNAGPYYQEVLDHVDICQRDSFLPRAQRIELVVGNIEDTAAQYVADHPGMRISLLHLDVDIYKPTLAALQAFYPLVVPGGVVVFDEYGMGEWGGESAAFDEYFGAEAKMKLRCPPITSIPTAYFVKGESL